MVTLLNEPNRSFVLLGLIAYSARKKLRQVIRELEKWHFHPRKWKTAPDFFNYLDDTEMVFLVYPRKSFTGFWAIIDVMNHTPNMPICLHPDCRLNHCSNIDPKWVMFSLGERKGQWASHSMLVGEIPEIPIQWWGTQLRNQSNKRLTIILAGQFRRWLPLTVEDEESVDEFSAVSELFAIPLLLRALQKWMHTTAT